MTRNTTLTTFGLLAALAAASVAPAMANQQSDKNNARNLALGGVAVAAFGLLTHNNTATLLGAAGAAVAGSQYENDRQRQSQDSGRYYHYDNYGNGGYNNYGNGGYSNGGYGNGGYDRNGYNQSGFNHEGYNRKGFDRDGFNHEGYNRDGFNRSGEYQDGRTQYRDNQDRDNQDQQWDQERDNLRQNQNDDGRWGGNRSDR